MSRPDFVDTGEEKACDAWNVRSLFGRRPCRVRRRDIVNGRNVFFVWARYVDISEVETLVRWRLPHQGPLSSRDRNEAGRPHEIFQGIELLPCGCNRTTDRLVGVHTLDTALEARFRSELVASGFQGLEIPREIRLSRGFQPIERHLHHLRRLKHVSEELRTDGVRVRAPLLLRREPGICLPERLDSGSVG